MDLPNVTMNFSGSMYSSIYDKFNLTCELNQYALAQNTNRLPIICLYLSLAIVVLLGFFWIVLPWLTKWKYYELAKESIPGMAFVLSIWLPLILMYFTLKFTEKSFKVLESWLVVFAVMIILSTVWFYRWRILAWFQSLK